MALFNYSSCSSSSDDNTIGDSSFPDCFFDECRSLKSISSALRFFDVDNDNDSFREDGGVEDDDNNDDDDEDVEDKDDDDIVLLKYFSKPLLGFGSGWHCGQKNTLRDLPTSSLNPFF